MSTVSVARSFPGTVHEAEVLWCDTRSWPAWVDGLARVVSVADAWPKPDAQVVWESGPAGRGTVTERVVEHEPLARLVTDVQDDSIVGKQTVQFSPAGDDVEIAFALTYEIRRRTIFTPLVDVLFIRRAMTISLRSTLERFGAQLANARDSGRPSRA